MIWCWKQELLITAVSRKFTSCNHDFVQFQGVYPWVSHFSSIGHLFQHLKCFLSVKVKGEQWLYTSLCLQILRTTTSYVKIVAFCVSRGKVWKISSSDVKQFESVLVGAEDYKFQKGKHLGVLQVTSITPSNLWPSCQRSSCIVGNVGTRFWKENVWNKKNTRSLVLLHQSIQLHLRACSVFAQLSWR